MKYLRRRNLCSSVSPVSLKNPPTRFVILSACHGQESGPLLDCAQGGEDNKSGDKKGKPGITHVPSSFGDPISNQVEYEENGNDQDESIVLALQHGPPAEGDGRGLPAAQSGEKSRRGRGPGFEIIAELLAQIRLLGQHDTLVVKGKRATGQDRQPPDVRPKGHADQDQIIAQVKRMAHDGVNAGGV